jgi:hypothetical protein
MRRPIVGLALPIAGVILIAWSILFGDPNETAAVWVFRTLLVYPVCHVGVRIYRNAR